MAIKINTAYGEILTSNMLNEKVSGIVGGNEKVSGFDVAIKTSTSVTIQPGRAYINGCSIEETSSVNTVSLNKEMLSNDGVAYIVLSYTHTTQRVEFSCVTEVTSNMAKLATLTIENGAIIELINHEHINTLNTVVGASADVEAQKIRDMIPSGFIELGQLDYDFMLNTEHKVKIKSKSIAYVHGYRVEIPADTIIDIGKAPEAKSREDLLFLEAWKDSDFTKSGKLKWRIRHVANVEPAGVPEMGIFEGWRETSYSMATGQGRLPQPLVEDKEKPRNYFYFGAFRQTWSHPSSDIIDNGLGVCSEADSYAIPMFRLHRKPSCGQSAPFEYSKINPKVDYSKFAKLVSDEKIERVITDSIQGRSLVNLAHSSSITLSKNRYSTLTKNNPIRPNTEYTIILTVSDIVGFTAGKYLRLVVRPVGGSSDCSSDVNMNMTSAGLALGRVVFKMPSQPMSIEQLYIHVSGGEEGNSVKLTDLMILEGNWTNKQIPKFFTELKSLGEDDGNLITVKNGVVDKDTYDINDGTQKLTTFSGVTHIHSDNCITPVVDAVIKNNDQQTPLEKLGSTLETEGTEIVEFTKIKGKTMQNCYPELVSSSFVNSHGSVSDGYITLQGTGTGYRNAFIPVSKCAIKPNSKYTMVVDIVESTLQQNLKLATPNSEDVFKTEADTFIQTSDKAKKGIHKYVVTSVGQITDGMYGLRAYLNTTETGKIKFRIVLLEGDYTDTPVEQLPFIQGIKSVGEAESNVISVNSCGKNEFKDMNYVAKSDCIHKNVPIHYVTNPTKQYTVSVGSFKNQTTHNPTWCSLLGFQYTDGTSSEFYPRNGKSAPSVKGKVIKYIYVRDPWNTQSIFYNVQIEEGAQATEYEAYKGCTQNVYLKEPLRSLPNGVCDEIVGNKVIRRTGQQTFVGAANEGWVEIRDRHLTNTLYFEVRKVYNADRSIRCDRFPTKLGGDSASVWTTDSEVCNFDNHWNFLVVRINRNKLATPDLQGFKTWLSQNPLTVVYGLPHAENEYLENVYKKESVKTYQLDAPLRSLPGGIKDEIVDGVLIRRCGERIFDGTEKWQETGDAYYLNNTGNTYYKSYSATMSNSLTVTTGVNYFPMIKKANVRHITSLADLVSSMRENPLKVIYEMAKPIHIPLTEVKHQAANFSLQRQFAEGNWLKELPNGTRDTVENSKVKRRVTKLILDGDEDWSGHSNNTTDGGTLYRYFLPISSLAPIGSKIDVLLCDKLTVVNDVQQEIWSGENIHYRIDSSKAGIYIVKDKITTLESFRAWLRENPVSIIAPLATLKDEVLAADNCALYPCHDFNTYCGSMYVGEGRNDILNDNRMPSGDPMKIETEFRGMTGSAKIEDCRYKKCDDGYILKRIPPNLFNKDTISNNHAIDVNNGALIPCVGTAASDFIDVKPNTEYMPANGAFHVIEYRVNKEKIAYRGVISEGQIVRTGAETKWVRLYRYNIKLDEVKFVEVSGDVGYKAAFENTAENDIEDLRHQVSLTGFDYNKILNESFDRLLRGEL